jgi:RNA polymerase sigma-70 factor (ECF subfamily)
MEQESKFRSLIAQVRAGSQSAARELVALYEPAIRRAARVRLVDSRLRRLFDSMDISQSVFASFFLRAALGQYELNEPQQLLRLLVSMSRKKLIDHARHEAAARRDYRRKAVGKPTEAALVSRDASPSSEIALQELLQQFCSRLSPEEKRLADLRAAGRDWTAIAAEIGDGAESLRKRLARAINRIATELKLEEFTHE